MPRLTPEQKERAVNLQKRHWTHARIAYELKVSRPTVSLFLGKHNDRVIERLLKRCAAEKARQLQQLEHLASEAYAAWERSQQDRETVKTTERPDDPGPDGEARQTTQTETTLAGQVGDPTFLRECRAAMADRRTILGIGREKDPDALTVRDVLAEAEERDGSYQPARPPSADEVGPAP